MPTIPRTTVRPYDHRCVPMILCTYRGACCVFVRSVSGATRSKSRGCTAASYLSYSVPCFWICSYHRRVDSICRETPPKDESDGFPLIIGHSIWGPITRLLDHSKHSVPFFVAVFRVSCAAPEGMAPCRCLARNARILLWYAIVCTYVFYNRRLLNSPFFFITFIVRDTLCLQNSNQCAPLAAKAALWRIQPPVEFRSTAHAEDAVAGVLHPLLSTAVGAEA